MVWVREKRQRGKDKRSGPKRTLVVVWGFGKNPLVLLANEYLPDRASALKILKAYIRRWRAEETNRAMKDSHGWGIRLEDVRALKFRGVERILMLASAVYLFLSELTAASKDVVKQVMAFVGTFGPCPPDGRYRLMRGFGTALFQIPGWLLRKWTRERRCTA